MGSLRSFLVIALIIFVGAIGTSAVAGDAVGAWTFDDNNTEIAKDISGTGNDGAINGSVEWVQNGKFGGALQFNGVDGFIEVADHETLQFPQGTDFTLACWLKILGDHAAPPMLIAKNYHAKDQVLPWYALYYANQQKKSDGDVSIFLRDASSTSFFIAAGTPINDGEWHHVATTREVGTLRLYVDGEEKASLDGADVDVGTNDAPLHMMSHYGRFMNAQLDEALIYQRALSANEISDLNESGYAAVTSVDAKGKLTSTWSRIKTE